MTFRGFVNKRLWARRQFYHTKYKVKEGAEKAYRHGRVRLEVRYANYRNHRRRRAAARRTYRRHRHHRNRYGRFARRR